MTALYIFAFFVLTIVILAIVFLMLIIFNVIPSPNTTTPTNTVIKTQEIIKTQQIIKEEAGPKLQLATVVMPKIPEQQHVYVPLHYLAFGMASVNMQKSSRYMSVSQTTMDSVYHLQLPASSAVTWRLCLPMTDVPLSNRPPNSASGTTIYVQKDEQTYPATVSVLTDRILIDSDAFTPGAIVNIPKTTFEKKQL